MTHPRQHIRDAVVNAVTGLTRTGNHVFAGRVYPLQSSQLPGLCVYTRDEVSEQVSFTTMMRELTLVVEIYVKEHNTYENIIDSIAGDVESAIMNDAGVQGLVKHMHLSASQVDVRKEGDKPVAIGVLSFFCQYTTTVKQPMTIT